MIPDERQIKSVIGAIEFMEKNLRENLLIGDVAAEANYSLFHFSRLFNKTTMFTPYDYLMRRRLSESALLLLKGKHKVINVAFEFGFNSPENFSRAFRKMFRMTPTEIMEAGNIDSWRLFPPLTLDYLYHIHSLSSSPPVIKYPYEIKGKKEYFRYELSREQELLAIFPDKERKRESAPPGEKIVSILQRGAELNLNNTLKFLLCFCSVKMGFEASDHYYIRTEKKGKKKDAEKKYLISAPVKIR